MPIVAPALRCNRHRPSWGTPAPARPPAARLPATAGARAPDPPGHPQQGQQRRALVYRATQPLEGPPWQELGRALGPLFPPELALHHTLLLATPGDRILLFDFLPADPTSPFTAALLLTGRTVPGVTRVRELRRLPRWRCVLVGAARHPDPVRAALAFSADYGHELSLTRRHCGHFVDSLTALLDVEA
eukprot:scaffold1.g5274.t1